PAQHIGEALHARTAIALDRVQHAVLHRMHQAGVAQPAGQAHPPPHHHVTRHRYVTTARRAGPTLLPELGQQAARAGDVGKRHRRLVATHPLKETPADKRRTPRLTFVETRRRQVLAHNGPQLSPPISRAFAFSSPIAAASAARPRVLPPRTGSVAKSTALGVLMNGFGFCRLHHVSGPATPSTTSG